MSYTIAIHPDFVQYPSGRQDRLSEVWAETLLARGHAVRHVDLRRSDIFAQLSGCDALMWRRLHTPEDHALAIRVLPVIEHELGLCVYPNQRTCWHYDDKIAQAYLLKAAGIPTPQTWVFWQQETALEFVQTAAYPLVAKLSTGASSENVRLVHSRDEAEALVRRMFDRGLRKFAGTSFAEPPCWADRVKNAARWLVRGREPSPGRWWVLQKDYVYFQEFVAGNEFDTRVTIVGNRAYFMKRFNPPGDFRASGSTNRDRDPASCDPRFLRLGFQLVERLGMQTCCLDGLLRDGEPVISEISYTGTTHALADYPGTWELIGDWQTGGFVWRPGQTRPEPLQVEMILRDLDLRRRDATTNLSPESARANR